MITKLVSFIKDFYLKNSINLPQQSKTNLKINYYNIISKCYDELSKEFNSLKINKKINKKFIKYYNFLENMNYYMGYTYILKENLYVKNIKEISINMLYPKILSLIYHNTNIADNYKYYILLVDNYNEIKKHLNENEYHLLKLIINYKVGWFHNNNNSKILLILFSFLKYYFNDLIKNDKYNDIFYIDTDLIYITNTREGNKLIKKHFKLLFNDINIKEYKYGFFVAKKRYFLFDNKPYVKGYDIKNAKYLNKQIANTAYKISKTKENYISFNKIRCKNYNKLMKKALKIENRIDKISRLLF